MEGGHAVDRVEADEPKAIMLGSLTASSMKEAILMERDIRLEKITRLSALRSIKRLDKGQFFDRVGSLFPKALPSDLSNAYSVYLFIYHRDRTPSPMSFADRFETPVCPKCGEGRLQLKGLLPKGPNNRNGYKSLWYCTTGDCIHEHYSRTPLKDQLDKLKLREAPEGDFREMMIDRARAVFVHSGLTPNLSEALWAYREITFPEPDTQKKLPIASSARTMKSKAPACPACREGLLLFLNLPKQGRYNLYGYKRLYYCSSCGYEKLSKEESYDLSKIA